MKYNPNKQRRMWLGTIWLGHCDTDCEQTDPHDLITEVYVAKWNQIINHPCVDFARGQIEVADTGALHIQCAIHTTDSKRWSWMANNLPANWEPAANWDAVINYASKTDSRIRGLAELGERPERAKSAENGSLKIRAIQYLKEGHDPRWIAINHPEVYFVHGRAIDRLYQHVYLAWAKRVGHDNRNTGDSEPTSSE
jgi:hypothetical protein